MNIYPKNKDAIFTSAIVCLTVLTMLQPACDKNDKPYSPNPGDSLIISPLVPYNPQPANGAANIGDEFTCGWQCYNPDSLSLEFYVYMGVDSLMPIRGWGGASNFTIPWATQIRAKEILVQVYQMQTAYRAQYGSYCLRDISASRSRPDAFGQIGVIIDSSDIYTYDMWADSNTFTCCATGNLDDDPTFDLWKIDQSGLLDLCMSDFPDGLSSFEFHPASTYSWRVLVLYNADHDSVWGPIWRFTTTSDIVPPENEAGFPRFSFPEDNAVGVTCSTLFCWCSIRVDDDPLTYDLYLAAGDNEPQLHSRNMTSNRIYLDWGSQWKVQEKLQQIYIGEQYFKIYGYDSCFVLNGVSAFYGQNYFYMLGVNMEENDIFTYTISASCDTFVCTAAANIDTDPEIDTWTIDQTGTIRHLVEDSNIPFIPGQSYSWKIIAHDTRGNSFEGPIWHFTAAY